MNGETLHSKNKKIWRPSDKHANRPKYLLDKVVLLVGTDTAVLQNLVAKLAQKGANIALLCWQMPQETLHTIKAHVQELGRKLLVIEQAKQQQQTSSQLVETINSELGSLDIFIDLSVEEENKDRSLDSAKEKNTVELAPNWHLRQAVLEELVFS